MHDIKFSKLLNIITSIKSEEINKDYLEKYQQQVNQYARVETVENPLEFSIKGDIISVWLAGYTHPVKVEFFGEDVEKIYEYDQFTGRKLREVSELVLTQKLPLDKGELQEFQIKHSQSENFGKLIFTSKDITGIENYYSDYDFDILDSDFTYPALYFSNLNLFTQEVEKLKNNNFQVIINTKHEDDLAPNLKSLLLKNSTVEQKKSFSLLFGNLELENLRNIPAGFISNQHKLAFFTDRELFGSIYLNKVKTQQYSSNRLKKLLAQFEGEIKIGDNVVHEDYGISTYNGLKHEIVGGIHSDYLLLKFAEDDELYVPLTQIEKITRYLNNSDTPPKLSRLSRGRWQAVKERIKKSTLILAKELVTHYAKRELSKSQPIPVEDSKIYLDFVEEFKHNETKDQITSIKEIIADLQRDKPMNRLLVGDVGYGKTELIMRAAFKIVEDGGQVAVLSPTTVLTQQHLNVFRERFKNVPITIKAVSRFNTDIENRKIIDHLGDGSVDVIIGTHRLLSSDIKFKNLRLLVVDEEQKFGVKQKEKIKQLNYGVHVLSVSATPIPRTLSLALSSVQDISIITTPPKGRIPIDTEIIYEDWNKAVNAIQFEITRGGQVYFLHNRVETIQSIRLKLQNFLPNIKFVLAHGQMSSAELDRIMSDFYAGKYEVLISTSIIESGLDLPNVNTIIMHNAHKFGLSQLYQLRGRVGRSDRQAYCYLMCPKPRKSKLANEFREDATAAKRLKEKDQKSQLYLERLKALVENNELGSSFNIASKDLEIRGAGSILGEKQHGHIAEIGYALYIEMLAQEVERLRTLSESGNLERDLL